MATKHTLLSPMELAKDAYSIYKVRIFTIFGLSITSFLFTVLGLVILGALGVAGYFLGGAKPQVSTLAPIGVLALIGLIGIIFLSVWFQAAQLVAIRDWKNTSVKLALAKAWPYVVPLFLTLLLQHVLTFGSFFVFVFPAILFSIWFAFASYIVVVEDKKGFAALHTSREYVRGRIWGIIGRAIVIFLPEMLLGAIISGVSKSGQSFSGLEGLYGLVSIVLRPFYMMYLFRLYENVKETANSVKLPVPAANKRVYLFVPILGLILFAAGVVGFISVAPKLMNAANQYMSQSGLVPNEAGKIKSSTTIMYGIIQYVGQKGSFPITLDDLVTAQILPAIPNEEKSGKPYQYTMLENGKDFKLCTPKGVTPQKCVTSKSSSFDL